MTPIVADPIKSEKSKLGHYLLARWLDRKIEYFAPPLGYIGAEFDISL